MAQTNLLHLLNKRQHVFEYDNDNIPEKQMIEDLLWKAWKVTPSKNNFMPYHCNVLGPDKQEDKDKVWEKSYIHKKGIDDSVDCPDKGDNPFFRQLKTAPYVLVFTQRVCEPNEYYRKRIEIGDWYEQMHADQMDNMLDITAIEVGMWMANLSAFALDKGLNTSVIKCYPNKLSHWKDISWIEHPVVLIATIGQAKTLRREVLNDTQKKDDKKPEPEEIIKWI
tara:strand:+ start:222 stop:890 length:669 start_codon:yes stop_codon:yes gene_type:complete